MNDQRETDRRGQPSSSDTGAFSTSDDLAVQLSELARDLQQEPTLQETLDGIVQAAVQNVPGAQLAGISLVEGRRAITTPAYTDDLVARVDQAQYDSGQGPCLSTIYESHTVRLSDMAGETRWPRFTERAVELGIGSMLSVQLYVQAEDLGALNLYNYQADGFTDESEHIGLLLASHAAVAMAGAQRQHHLGLGLDTRDLIGQAKGILMERFKIRSDQAFQVLIRASQTTNTKLRDVAEQLALSGELAGRPG